MKYLMNMLLSIICVSLWMMLLLTDLASAAISGQVLPEMLQHYFRFSSGDLRKMEAGEIVVKVLDLGVSHEIAALGVVRTTAPKERLVEQFRDIVAFKNNPLVKEIGTLVTYLREFPRGALEQVEDFVYWSKEKLGPKPAISVSHVTIYQRQHNDGEDVFITSKQLYANHYSETSLGLTFFMDAVNTTGPPTSYLICLNRSRLDILRGTLWKIIRPIAKRKIKSGWNHRNEMHKP